MKTIWCFSDLDDSAFSNARTAPEAGAKPVAFNAAGSPVGYITPRQQAFLDLMSEQTVLVPTTARETSSFSRVLLPPTEYAILAMGAVVVRNGQPDSRWHNIIEPQAQAATGELQQLYERAVQVAADNSFDTRMQVIGDLGMQLYLSIKHNRKDLAEMVELRNILAQVVADGWRIYPSKTSLAILPPYLGKEHAVSWFKENIVPEGALMLGFGDSSFDLSFLAMCDLAITTSQSSLFTNLRNSF